MIDLNAAAVSAIAGKSAWAYPLVYAVGVMSSTGPCAAPRVLAFSSFMLRSQKPKRTAAAFLAGTLGMYGALGYVGGLVANLVGISSWVYGVIALAAILGGLWTVIGASWCEHDAPQPTKAGDAIGAAFLTGAGFSLVVSPCCAPLIGVVVAYAGSMGGSWSAALLLVSFGIGHASPVFTAMMFGKKLTSFLTTSRFSQGATVVGGAAMVVLGAYYALLV